MHSCKAASLDVSAAASDDFFDDLFSLPQTSTGTVTAADKLQVYGVEVVWAAVMGSGR